MQPGRSARRLEPCAARRRVIASNPRLQSEDGTARDLALALQHDFVVRRAPRTNSRQILRARPRHRPERLRSTGTEAQSQGRPKRPGNPRIRSRISRVQLGYPDEGGSAQLSLIAYARRISDVGAK